MARTSRREFIGKTMLVGAAAATVGMAGAAAIPDLIPTILPASEAEASSSVDVDSALPWATVEDLGTVEAGAPRAVLVAPDELSVVTQILLPYRGWPSDDSPLWMAWNEPLEQFLGKTGYDYSTHEHISDDGRLIRLTAWAWVPRAEAAEVALRWSDTFLRWWAVERYVQFDQPSRGYGRVGVLDTARLPITDPDTGTPGHEVAQALIRLGGQVDQQLLHSGARPDAAPATDRGVAFPLAFPLSMATSTSTSTSMATAVTIGEWRMADRG